MRIAGRRRSILYRKNESLNFHGLTGNNRSALSIDAQAGTFLLLLPAAEDIELFDVSCVPISERPLRLGRARRGGPQVRKVEVGDIEPSGGRQREEGSILEIRRKN